MSRKGRKPRKKVARAPTRSAGAPAKRAADRLLGQPIFAGTRDDKRARAYLDKFMQFELWLLDGATEATEPRDIPHEHRYILERWPDAFELFRHAMWSYAERVLRMNPWTSTLRSVMVRCRATDPAGFAQLDTAITAALPRFMVQRHNVLHQIRDDDPSVSARERFRAMIKLYADMYEVDFPLWLLCVLGTAYRTGVIDPAKFGGPTTTVAQGSLVDAAAAAVADTPLSPLLKQAYMPALRNVINHNAYEIVLGGPQGDALEAVRDPDTGTTWPAGVIHDAWHNTSDLMNAAMSACASIQNVLAPSAQSQFRDYGVVGIVYCVVAGVPHAFVAQLWCFRDIDPDGTWLDEAEFFVEADPGGTVRAGFTQQAFMTGGPLAPVVTDALRDRRWIRVVRYPVAPHMGVGFPVMEHPDAGEYEIVGVPDEHDVPLRDTLP